MRWVPPALACLVACVDGGLVPCGDLLCPPGRTCHAATGACVSSQQIEACRGLADLDPCTVEGLAGFCRTGVCLPPRCGDGIVHAMVGEDCDEGAANSNLPDATCRLDCQPAVCGDAIVDPGRGEVCDDGNLEPADGCAPGCGSDETCGNAVLDLGEECDDGNRRARDGCSACSIERLVAQVRGAVFAPLRASPAMAYDAARERVVLFGGATQNGSLRGDTWEWDGLRWRQIVVTGRPSSRTEAAAAYDASRRRVVLFGGADVADNADTWEFDGALWTRREPALSPPARRGHAMTYDARRKRVVMFGGRSGSASYGDLWGWDGVTWTLISAGGGPLPRHATAIAYDPIRDQIVLFGGSVGGDETWIWDGASWQQRLVPGPPSRFGHVAAFDPSREVVVVVSGWQRSDVWHWDGTAWTQQPSTTPRPFAGLVYDIARRELVLSHGSQGLGATTLRRPTGFGFVAPPLQASPSGRNHAAAAYDPLRGRVVLYGGYDSVVRDDTWEWDGQSWSTAGAGAPGPRRAAAMATGGDGHVVLHGGQALGPGNWIGNADLWKWDGTLWTQVLPVGPASPRFSHGMVYDAARSRLVVYGGGVDGGWSDEVWERDAQGWTNVTAPGTPGSRLNFAMGYDPLRARTLVIGGSAPLGIARSHEYDGSAWTEVKSAPVEGKGSALVFDPNRRRMIWVVAPDNTELQLWEWDGATWTRRLTEPALSSRYRPAVAYDAARSELVVFGGRTDRSTNTNLAATVAISYQPNAAVEACTDDIDYDGDGDAGCADSDCAGLCHPLCLDGACPPGAPHCGDGVCEPMLETCRLCPGDCGPCPPGDCGDFRCDGVETAATCPGDCA